MKSTEDALQQRLSKARDKLEKLEEEVAMWEDLLKIVRTPERKLTET